MSVDSTEENGVKTIEASAVNGSVFSSMNDDAIGTFEIEHDLLLQSTDSTNEALTGMVPLV